ncbi:MAG: response regulator transcription factor [Cyanobacteria bacterium P01_A01_bin.40]
MTTVLIVDDLNSIREFLKINLSSEPDIQVVGLADNGTRAIAQVEEHQPDIVLMDIEMPGMLDGIQATEKITQRFSQSKVLLLTSQDDRQQLDRALKAGARGYILKNTSVKDIANIIRLTEKGFFQIGPILGNWDGTLHRNLQSNISSLAVGNDNGNVGAIIQDPTYKDHPDEAFDMNFVLSNLSSGLFQLQESIKSQEDTIANLTHKYSQVQQEIKAKLKSNRHLVKQPRAISYSFKASPTRYTQNRQHLLFIGSFFLGALTVLFLMLLLILLGS